MLILGIETSCDETGIALYHTERGLLAHDVYSQVQMHDEFGGVVPELASRDQIRKVLPMIKHQCAQGGIKLADLDGIAYTRGPGLAGALLVGATIGRSLGWALGLPTIGVHHMEAHLLAPLLEERQPEYPFLALVVSGGHTLLVRVMALGQYEILGESLDDAVGEAFDKTARLLGLPYPGGPHLSELAQKGDPRRFIFPRPMLNRPGLDFSFSGLKTFAVNTWHKYGDDSQTKADIACAFELAAVDALIKKCERAIKQTGIKSLVVAGGVSANRELRDQLTTLEVVHKVEVFLPRHEFCTDNGAMVAFAGAQHLLAGRRDDLAISIKPRWPLDSLCQSG